jgi:hypothetical protein
VLREIPANGNHPGPIFEEVDQVMRIAIATSSIPSERPIPPEPVPPPEPLVPPTEPPIPPPWPPQPPPEPEPPVLAVPPLGLAGGTTFGYVDTFSAEEWQSSDSRTTCALAGRPVRPIGISLWMATGVNTYGLLICPMSDTARCCLQPGRVDPTSRRRWEALLAAVATV